MLEQGGALSRVPPAADESVEQVSTCAAAVIERATGDDGLDEPSKSTTVCEQPSHNAAAGGRRVRSPRDLRKRSVSDLADEAASDRVTAQRVDGLSYSERAQLKLLASVPALRNHRDARGRRHGIAVDMSTYVTELVSGELADLVGGSQL